MEKDYTLEDAPFHLDTNGPGYNALFFATFRLCNVSSTYAKTPFQFLSCFPINIPPHGTNLFVRRGGMFL